MAADFDMSAAWLRKAQGDHKAFMEGFAIRLSDALPGRVTVERSGLPIFGNRRVTRVSAAFENQLYSLSFIGGGLDATIAKVVRGVALGSDKVPVPQWLAGLMQETGKLADSAGAAQSALHDFLMS